MLPHVRRLNNIISHFCIRLAFQDLDLGSYSLEGRLPERWSRGHTKGCLLGAIFLLFSKYRSWPFYLMPCFFFFFVSSQQVRPSNTGRWGKYIVFFIFKLLWTEIIWLQNTSGQSKKFNLALNKATPSLSYVFFSIYPPSFAQIYLPYLWLFPRLSLTGI